MFRRLGPTFGALKIHELYFALWVDSIADISDEYPDAFLDGCAHVSLLRAPMPSEDVAIKFADALLKRLAQLKKKPRQQLCGKAPVNESWPGRDSDWGSDRDSDRDRDRD